MDEAPKRPERSDSGEEKPKAKSAKAKAPSRRRQRDDDAPAAPGLGDHMPAFLKRPARPKSKD